jgi:hypothetical protein
VIGHGGRDLSGDLTGWVLCVIHVNNENGDHERGAASFEQGSQAGGGR